MLEYPRQCNRPPKTSAWAADGDLILGKIQRLPKQMSDSGQQLLLNSEVMPPPAPSECKKLINSDLYRHLGRTGLRPFLYAYFRRPGFRYMFFFRKTQDHFKKRSGLNRIAYVLYRLFLEHYGVKYGFDIGVGAQIGSGLYINHFGTVMINPRAKLGSNVNLAQGVTIGVSYDGKVGIPVVNDRVWIGANAIIVGGITIGEGAMIAPGAFVNFDVAPNAVILGNPGRVVSNKGSAAYIHNMVEHDGSIPPSVL